MSGRKAILKTALGELELPEEFETVLAHVNRSYYVTDADARLLDIGPVLLDLLNYERADLLSESFEVLFCPSYRELATVMFETVMDDVPEPERVWSYRKSNGDLVKIVADHLQVSLPDRPRLCLGLVRLIQIA